MIRLLAALTLAISMATAASAAEWQVLPISSADTKYVADRSGLAGSGSVKVFSATVYQESTKYGGTRIPIEANCDSRTIRYLSGGGVTIDVERAYHEPTAGSGSAALLSFACDPDTGARTWPTSVAAAQAAFAQSKLQPGSDPPSTLVKGPVATTWIFDNGQSADGSYWWPCPLGYFYEALTRNCAVDTAEPPPGITNPNYRGPQPMPPPAPSSPEQPALFTTHPVPPSGANPCAQAEVWDQGRNKCWDQRDPAFRALLSR